MTPRDLSVAELDKWLALMRGSYDFVMARAVRDLVEKKCREAIDADRLEAVVDRRQDRIEWEVVDRIVAKVMGEA